MMLRAHFIGLRYLPQLAAEKASKHWGSMKLKARKSDNFLVLALWACVSSEIDIYTISMAFANTQISYHILINVDGICQCDICTSI